MPPTAFDAERFRREASAVVDWIADYWTTLEARPVAPAVAPGSVRSALPDVAPEHPEPLTAVLADLEHLIVPGLMHWQHPAFFGYFPASTSAPSILGELLAAGLGVQGMLWATSPACTELETQSIEWLRSLLGLPERFAADGPGGGVIQDSASSGVLVAIVAARDQAMARHPDRPLVAYYGADAHSSIEKGLRIAGIDSARRRRIPLAAGGAIDVAALTAAVETDAAAGLCPFFVAATVGTTACGAIDPVPVIAAVAGRHGAWLHVDAAWAGTAALCPELRGPIVAGADRADSWGFNPHKWMLVNFDCHVLWVADRGPLVRALSMKPEYLRNAASESGAVIDYADWQVPLGRRFRALKLWMTLRMLGAEALRRHVRDHVAWAREFAACVAADPRFELLGEPSLSLVCFALRTGDEATAALLERVNAGGTAFLTHARVAGRYAIRLAIGGAITARRHVMAAWRTLADLA
jgi:aromatic-L-amino-acid decarboxylase